MLPAIEVNETAPVLATEAEKLLPSPPPPPAGTDASRSEPSSTWYTNTSVTGPLGSSVRLEADDSKAIQWPSGLIDGPRLSPLPCAPPAPTRIRTVEATDGGPPGSAGEPPEPAVGGVLGFPGLIVVRKTS